MTNAPIPPSGQEGNSLEPVAWLYEKVQPNTGHKSVVVIKRDEYAVGKGWTETALGPLAPKPADSQLVEVVAPPMPECSDREPFGCLPFSDKPLDGYMEGNRDWADRNNEVVEWLADNHSAIRAALAPHLLPSPLPSEGSEEGDAERDRIVAWLREIDLPEDDWSAGYLADMIASGAHIPKGDQREV